MIPSPLSAVIFDKDGLLLDTETVVRTAMFQAATDLGYRMADELHLSLIGHARDTNDAMLRRHYGVDFPLSAYRERCRIHFEHICRDAVPVKPGARELLSLLKEKRIPTAVATSTGRDRSEENLRRTELAGFIDVLVTRDEVRLAKPDPECFLKAAALLGAAPGECLALEDSHNGIRAAHAAGMATIMVPDMLQATPEIRSLCAGVVNSLHDVRDLIARAPLSGLPHRA
ncbi:MAG TPA: HAD family phosphatase [Micropepsaceae bacterium]|jgi:HAD superfamily hydrolase (TIGR01509 family)|nr:HAD family phosphatase [Micropepsaceae bacterium]